MEKTFKFNSLAEIEEQTREKYITLDDVCNNNRLFIKERDCHCLVDLSNVVEEFCELAVEMLFGYVEDYLINKIKKCGNEWYSHLVRYDLEKHEIDIHYVDNYTDMVIIRENILNHKIGD